MIHELKSNKCYNTNNISCVYVKCIVKNKNQGFDNFTYIYELVFQKYRQLLSNLPTILGLKIVNTYSLVFYDFGCVIILI